jgi:hypothetical protein
MKHVEIAAISWLAFQVKLPLCLTSVVSKAGN